MASRIQTDGRVAKLLCRAIKCPMCHKRIELGEQQLNELAEQKYRCEKCAADITIHGHDCIDVKLGNLCTADGSFETFHVPFNEMHLDGQMLCLDIKSCDFY